MATLVSPGQSLGPLQQTNLVGFAGLQPMAALNLLGQLGPGSQLVQAGQGPSFVQGQGGPLGLLVTSRGTHAVSGTPQHRRGENHLRSPPMVLSPRFNAECKSPPYALGVMGRPPSNMFMRRQSVTYIE